MGRTPNALDALEALGSPFVPQGDLAERLEDEDDYPDEQEISRFRKTRVAAGGTMLAIVSIVTLGIGFAIGMWYAKKKAKAGGSGW